MANNFFYTDIVIPAGSKLRLDGSASGTTYISESADGRMDFYADNKLLLTLQEDTESQVIINKDSADIDFRVKSATINDALFVQGSTGYLGIGTDAPGAKVDVTSPNNTLLRLISTDDICRIQLSDDDTTGYLGVTNDEISLGITGTLTSTNNLRIKDFGNSGSTGQVMSFGATPSVTDKVRFTRSVSTDDDVGRNLLKLDLNVSGTAAITGDRTYQGLFIDLDSTSTSGDTTDEVRLYGIQSNILDQGDADLTYGMFSFVKNTKSVANDNVTSLVAYQGNALAAHTAGHVTTVRGANITAQMDNAGGTVGTAYGGSFNVSQTTDSDKVVPTVYGVYAKVDTGANAAGGKFTTSEGVRAEIEMQQDVTMTTARAFHALLDVDDGIITNGYQFYGQTTLAAGAEITNHYGIYTTGCDLNRLGGTLQITNIPEIGSDTDKFIMSDGQILKYVTGDNLRSYIGAGTGTVTISGTPVAKEFAEWTDATTIKGSDTLAVNSSTDGINILGNDSVGTAVSILRLLRNNAVADDRFQFIIGSSTENYIYSGNSTDTHSLVFGLLDANNSNIEQVLKLKRGSGVQIPVCNEIGSDTDKFLMVSGTDNLIEYVTGDNLLSYIGGAPSSGGAYLPLVGGTMSGNIAMGDNDITGIDELKFNSGTKLGDGGGTDWVDLTYANSGDGGLRVKDINDQVQGYLYGTGGVTSDFGLLTGAGEWAVRTIENGLVELRHDNAVKLQTTNTGISVTGTLTVGSSGSSRFTDTSSFPLQLNRGLAVDVHGTNGVHLGLGSYTTGTTYVDAARIAANLEYNGTTASGDLFLQVNNSGTYSNALTINNDTNATFAGDLTVSDELTVSTISNATADPDKFLCANGNGKVGYRTGAQVLSDIGAGTVSGNGTSGRVAFWSGSSVITSDSDLTFNGSSLTVGGTISSTQGNYQSNAEVVMSNSSSQSTLNIGDAEETDGISLIRLKTAGSTQMTVDDGSVDLNTNVDFQVQGGDIRLLGDANINLDVSLSTGNTSGIILPIGSGSVVGGKFYYFAGLSWSQTDADNESSSKGLIAYAKSSGTPSTNRMLVSGIIYKASHGFILGSPLYLSTNPGDLQTTAPSGANDVARVVGYALDANHIFFRPDNTWVKIS